MRLAPETAQLCRDLADRFDELPTERVWGEFSKITGKAVKPSMAWQALHDTGWERHFPELAAVRDVPQDRLWHPEGPVHVHLGLAADAAAEAADRDGITGEDRSIVVMAAMLHDLGKATHTEVGERITSHGHAEAGKEPVASFLRRIGAPGRYAETIVPIVAEHMAVAGPDGARPTPRAVRKLMRRLDASGRGPGLKMWAAVVAADHAGRGPASGPSPADAWLRVAEQLGQEDRPPKGLLTGKHLIAAGMKPGPQFAPLLADALSAQDDGVFDDEAGAMAWLNQRIG